MPLKQNVPQHSHVVDRDPPRTGLPPRPAAAIWCPLALAALLYLASPRRGRAGEESIDFKVLYYQEDNDRIQVISPTFLYENEISPTLTIKVDGIYNAISGATPTGAPPIPKTVISSSLINAGNFSVLSGATSQTSSPSQPASTSSGGGGSTAVSRRNTGPISQSDFLEVQTAELDDTRIGANVELAKRYDDRTVTGQLSGSVESVYTSLGIALKEAREYRNKNTVVTYGGALTHDLIDNFNEGSSETKDSLDLLTGITQILSPEMLASANLTLGFVSGYMDDAYKVVQLNDALVPEHRPDSKTRQILYLSLLRHIASLNGTVEGGYRFYNDSFGIRGNTLSLAWFQKLGDRVTLKPMIRHYDQTEADFYAVRFTGAPSEYSADYRISALTALSYGLQLIIRPNENTALDIGYEYYQQEGDDGVTLDATYPSAAIVKAGVKIWF